MQGLHDTLKQATEVSGQLRQAEFQQGWLDLARLQQRQLREEEERSRRLQERVLDQNMGYRDFRAGIAAWKVDQETMDAFTPARNAHPDFDALLPVMRIASDSLRSQWASITMTEYVECLYAGAKNAGFAAPARVVLLVEKAK